MAKPMNSAVVRGLGKPLTIKEVGTRKDLAQAIALAAEGKFRAHAHRTKLECIINKVFTDLKSGRVDGRIVLHIV